MTLAVYGSDGITYDRDALTRWVSERQTCPATRLPVDQEWINDFMGREGNKCPHNLAMQEAVDEFMQGAQVQVHQQNSQIILRK